MNQALLILNDSIFVFFDLLIFMQVITLKKNIRHIREMMYTGCAVILLVYFLATYNWELPPSISALFFLAIPSLLLFSFVSEYRGSRFLQTFCSVNTVTYAAAYIPRWIAMLLPPEGTAIVFVLSMVIFSIIVKLSLPYFKRYRDLLKVEEEGWSSMAAASAIIYAVLVLAASYPKPLSERTDYAFSYLLLCVAILSCYYIFVQSLIKSGVIYRQNLKLKQVQKLYNIAYTDSLTGVFSRAAYNEQTEKLGNSKGRGQIGLIIFDMNHFKEINDMYGHQYGDSVLQFAADTIQTVFVEENYTVYRFGGDEFVILDIIGDREEIERKVSLVQWYLERCRKFEFPLSAAAGFAVREAESDESFESLFSRADRDMYEHKNDKR